jgi:hypothetical protein
MIRGALQPLRTSELAQPALPVLCYVCEAANTRDAEYCCRCSAPMALAHQALGPTARPKMIALLGPSGSGKTVYLGMLMDMLSRQSVPGTPGSRLQIVARGAFSIGLQQATVSALASCEFPAKTGTEPERWSWMHCEIHRNEALAGEPPALSGRPGAVAPRKRRAAAAVKDPRVELVMPDMAGEAILEEVEHPQTFFVVRALLRNSAAALLLVDAAELGQGRRGPDFAAMKILSCLKELELQGGVGRRSRRPVALVLTKVDQMESCRKDPEEFARTHAVGTWQHCRQAFRDYAFFAASVVGCCTWLEVRGEGRRQAPLRVEPHGIIEPFAWILEKLHPVEKR